MYEIVRDFLLLLNLINVKTAPYRSKGVLRNYHSRSDPKLVQVVISVVIIPFSFQACTTQLSLSWDSKIKDTCNQPIYVIVYGCKYSLMLGYHYNWIIMNFLDDLLYEV